MIKFDTDALQDLITDNNLNESKLAKKIGVSRACVNRILKKTRNPSLKFLTGLKEAFPQYNLEEFFLEITLPNSDTLG